MSRNGALRLEARACSATIALAGTSHWGGGQVKDRQSITEHQVERVWSQDSPSQIPRPAFTHRPVREGVEQKAKWHNVWEPLERSNLEGGRAIGTADAGQTHLRLTASDLMFSTRKARRHSGKTGATSSVKGGAQKNILAEALWKLNDSTFTTSSCTSFPNSRFRGRSCVVLVVVSAEALRKRDPS